MTSSSASPFEARQLSLPTPLHTPYPYLSTLLYDSLSNSLAFRHSDFSFSLYPSCNPLSLSSFPSPQTLIPSPTSAATFLRLQTTPNSTTTLFITSSPVLRPSSSTLLRFYVLRGDVFAKISVFSSSRDLEWDRAKGGVVFKINHGVSMKLSGGVNILSLYSVSNAKIWVFSVRLMAVDGGGEALKLMKCAVIDCCFPIFEVSVLFGYLILGEENGVRVFLLRPLVKGNKHRKEKRNTGKRFNFQNGLNDGADAVKVSNGGKITATDGDLSLLMAKGEKNTDSVKLKCTKLRQDCKDMGALFVAFENVRFNDTESAKTPGKSIKAISIQALSANNFVILDSVGDLHLLCLPYSLQGSNFPSLMKLTQSMKVVKMSVFHYLSTVTHTIWISDGCNTVHLLVIPDMDTSLDESEAKGTMDKIQQNSVINAIVTQAIFTSEKIQDIVPMDVKSVLILGQASLFAYSIS